MIGHEAGPLYFKDFAINKIHFFTIFVGDESGWEFSWMDHFEVGKFTYHIRLSSMTTFQTGSHICLGKQLKLCDQVVRK